MVINVFLGTGIFDSEYLPRHRIGWRIKHIFNFIFHFLSKVSLANKPFKNPFFILLFTFISICICLNLFSIVMFMPTKSEKKILLEHWDEWKILYSNSTYQEIKMKFFIDVTKGNQKDFLYKNQLDIKDFFYINRSELECALYFLDYLEKNWDFLFSFDMRHAIDEKDNHNKILIDGEECVDLKKIINVLIGNFFYLYFKKSDNI